MFEMRDQLFGALEALAYIRTRTKDRKTLREVQDCIDILLDSATSDLRIKFW